MHARVTDCFATTWISNQHMVQHVTAPQSQWRPSHRDRCRLSNIMRVSVLRYAPIRRQVSHKVWAFWLHQGFTRTTAFSGLHGRDDQSQPETTELLTCFELHSRSTSRPKSRHLLQVPPRATSQSPLPKPRVPNAGGCLLSKQWCIQQR